MMINISRMTTAEEERFKAICRSLGRSLSSVARVALIEYTEAHKDDPPAWLKDAEASLGKKLNYKSKL